MSNRRKEYDSRARIRLDSKQDLKSRGVESPDLAGATIMATMTGWGGWPLKLEPSR